MNVTAAILRLRPQSHTHTIRAHKFAYGIIQQHKMEVTQSTSSGGAPQHIGSAKNNNNSGNSRSTDRPRRGSFNPKLHALSKRPAAKPYRRQCDIYVSNKSNFKAQMKQCQELLYDTESNGEVYLHCLGNAIKRGITLALTLVQESNDALGYEANTSTIDLVDDLHPLNDEEDFSIQRRKNSCLHIKVFRQANKV